MAGEQWDMLLSDHGTVAVVAREHRLIRVCFECSPEDISASIRGLYPEAKRSSQVLIQEALSQLNAYFLGKRFTFNVPLDNDTLTPFAYEVHQALLRVPYGSVVSYGDLAALSGSPKAARAVGGVMSSNPFPLVVPCHRVVKADGRIGEYSSAHGPKTKAWLVEFERRIANT